MVEGTYTTYYSLILYVRQSVLLAFLSLILEILF